MINQEVVVSMVNKMMLNKNQSYSELSLSQPGRAKIKYIAQGHNLYYLEHSWNLSKYNDSLSALDSQKTMTESNWY